MYDLIGDIHGHATELEQILRELGYARKNGVYQRSDRMVVFLGDFIDRGPQIRETLEIVRPMVDGGHALAVMGNLVDNETPGAAGRVMRLADRTLAVADPVLRRTRAAA